LFFEGAATDLGLRVIGVDRPGIGRSDPHAYADLATWADDIEDLADQLRIDRFAVQGVSNGGPYAMACAVRLRERVRACGLISSMGPADLIRRYGSRFMRVAFWAARRFPKAFDRYIHALVPDARPTAADAEGRMRSMARGMPEADRLMFEEPRLRALLARAFSEHRAQGVVGGRHEVRVGLRPWGFAIGDVRPERLFLWHGEQDRIVPCKVARALAEALPGCEAAYFATEGHFSLAANHAAEILKHMR
jgi:pimeloyl-ACP methyl ester carboxylesterase